MASLTITRTAECAAHNHIQITLGGDVSRTLDVTMEDMRQPITPEDVEAFIRVSLRLAMKGLTPMASRAALTTGITVTIA